jgi:hypothetical protein
VGVVRLVVDEFQEVTGSAYLDGRPYQILSDAVGNLFFLQSSDIRVRMVDKDDSDDHSSSTGDSPAQASPNPRSRRGWATSALRLEALQLTAVPPLDCS